MKRKVTLPWDAASWRARTYAPRVTKVHGPVGEKCLIADGFGGYFDKTHKCCGFHVCSCERQGKIPLRDVTDDWIQANAPVPPSPGPVGPGYATGPGGHRLNPPGCDHADILKAKYAHLVELPWQFFCDEKGCEGHTSIDGRCHEPVCTCTHERGAISSGADDTIKCSSCFRPFPQEA